MSVSVDWVRRDLARACARLHEGADAKHQAPRIRAYLPLLKAEGFAQFREYPKGNKGWRLTGSGREIANEARCGDCDACQEWMLAPGQAPPCEECPLPPKRARS